MSATIIEPKRGTDVGRVVVDVEVCNVDDLRRSLRADLPAERVRRRSVPALVDSGATFFCMPESDIAALGLPFNRERDARTITGTMTLRVYGGARIEVEGRACDVEVVGLPEGRQVLLGQIPLEALDFWVDLTNQRLVGNPEHDGQWMAELF